MLTTIQGYYDQGKIILEEEAPVHTKTKVMVTFLTDINVNVKPKRILGSLKGKIEMPNDFDEPLDDLKDYM